MQMVFRSGCFKSNILNPYVRSECQMSVGFRAIEFGADGKKSGPKMENELSPDRLRIG